MKNCPTCNYPNPEHLNSCFKCSSTLSSASSQMNDGAFNSKTPMELIADAVGDSGDILATCDAVMIGDKSSGNMTLALTNTDMHFMYIDPNKKTITIKTKIDLSRIKKFSLVHMQQGFTGTNVIRFVIGDSVFEISRVKGEAFHNQVESALMRMRVMGNQDGVADEISKLSQLANDGILSEDEFERAKSLFLGKPMQQRDALLLTLRSLNDLYKSGVLSESEFNTKKWDILSRLNA